MNELYADHPQHDIQRHIAELARQGAHSAHVDIHRDHAVVTASLPTSPDPQAREFNTRLHPSKYRHTLVQALTEHIAPEGIRVTVTEHHYQPPRSVTLRNLNDDVLIRENVPDSPNHLYVTTADNIHGISVVYPDGTSTQHNFMNYRGMGGLLYSHDGAPGSRVLEKSFAAVLVVNDRRHPHSPEAAAPQALRMALDYVRNVMANPNAPGNPAVVWPQPHFLNLCRAFINESPDFPTPPTTCQYRAPGEQYTHTRLLPDDALCTDFDSVQLSTLLRALENALPGRYQIVRADHPAVPTIRLVAASALLYDGSTRDFPVRIWDRHHQSGRYDGMPMPHGERFSESFVARVREISLTLEIHQPGSDTPARTITIPADFYNDQDYNHHVLVVTDEADISPRELRLLTHLHSPDSAAVPQHFSESFYEEPHDWAGRHITDRLTMGETEAAQRLLQRAANAAAALIASDIPPGEYTASAQGGNANLTITVTVNPEGPTDPSPQLPNS